MPVFQGTGYLTRNRRSGFNTNTITTDTIKKKNTLTDTSEQSFIKHN